MSKSVHDPSKRILVADDDPLACEFVTRCLNEIGYATLAANDAARTVDLAARFEFCCVVLDCHLGTLNRGLELIRPLHRLNPMAPILMISADPSWSLVAEAMRCGAFVFWHKSEGLMDLLSAVTVAADEHELRSGGSKAVNLNDLEAEVIAQQLSGSGKNPSLTARDIGSSLEPVSEIMKRHGIPRWR